MENKNICREGHQVKYNPDAWEIMGDNFTNNYELGFLDYRKNILDTILSYKNDCDSLLDIACADGWFIEHLRLSGYTQFYIGIDITPNLIERAKKRMPKEKFQIGDAMKISILNNSFDFVLCAGILMHLPDYKKAISEACRVSNKFVMFSTYGTYNAVAYSQHDARNGFLNYFYTMKDITRSVPLNFKLIEFNSFTRKAGDHMFQFLYGRHYD